MSMLRTLDRRGTMPDDGLTLHTLHTDLADMADLADLADQPEPPSPPRDEAPLSGRRRTDAEGPTRRQETGGWSARATV